MIRSRRVIAAGVASLLCISLVLAQPPASRETPPRPADEMKLPSDAIVVIVEKVGDALRSVPRMVLLMPEKYAALTAEIERLKGQLQARQPVAVGAWKVTGRIDGDKARLRVYFGVNTSQKRAPVALACGRALAITSVQLDKETAPPPIWPSAEGFVVEVENEGRHEVVVDLVVRLREMAPAAVPAPPRNGGVADSPIGFDLDLPQCLVTAVDLELPDRVKAVEVNDQPAGESSLTGNRLVDGPGKASRLKVVWRPPQALVGPVPLLTARGRITAWLQSKQGDRVEAELTLQDLGRSTRKWELQVPPGATVRLARTEHRDRLSEEIRGSGSPDGRVTLSLVSPSIEPLPVVVSYTRPPGAGPLPLGPFHVEGATTQTGVIWVVAGADKRVRCLPPQPARSAFRAAPSPLEIKKPGEPTIAPPAGAVAAFQYWSQVGGERADPREPWFKIDTDTVLGQLETGVIHTLRLENTAGRNQWRLTTLLEAQPRRAEAERLELDWPSPWLLDRDSSPRPREIATVEEPPTGPRLRLQLNTDLLTLNKFKLTLEALATENLMRGEPFAAVPDYPYPSAVVRLPRPAQVFDHGEHRIVIEAPGFDLRVKQPNNPHLELVSQEAHRIEWKADRLAFLSHVALAWKPFRPEVRVDSVIDAVVTGRQVEVKHRLQFAFEEKGKDAIAEAELLVPPEVRASLGVIAGGKLVESGGRAGPLLRCTLDPPRSGSAGDATLVLRYWTPLRDSGVPLVSAAGATRGQMRVRVWVPPGNRVRTTQDTWKELKLELVEDQPRLPSLVLEGLRPAQTLVLRTEPAAAGERAVLVEQVLVQVRVGEGGFQQHRVRFLLRQLTADRLDLVFPAPLDSLNLQASLDGALLNWDVVETPRTSGDGGPAPAHIRLKVPPGSLRRAAALEVSYNVPPARATFLGALQSSLQPATIPGLLAGVPVCWQVDLPGGSVPVSLDPADGAWRWGRRGWLLAPRPSLNAGEVERWFWGEGDPRGAALSEEEAALVPAFVGWRGSLGPLTLYHVPQQAWLLVCSLVVLVLGLALGQVALGTRGGERKRGRLFWPLLVAIALGGGVAGLIWPGVVSAFLYGAQPGLAVVLVVLGVQWLLHERYRRRVVFMPGFRRVKSGSSLARATRPEKTASGSGRGEAAPALTGSHPGRAPATGSAPRRAEPSTVDAPPGEVKPQ